MKLYFIKRDGKFIKKVFSDSTLVFAYKEEDDEVYSFDEFSITRTLVDYLYNEGYLNKVNE